MEEKNYDCIKVKLADLIEEREISKKQAGIQGRNIEKLDRPIL